MRLPEKPVGWLPVVVRSLVLLPVFGMLLGGCGDKDYGFPYDDIALKGIPLRIEVAATPRLRYRGYRLRAEIPEGRGMLFLFPREETHAFVMTDTPVPLSIAFVDRSGSIFQMADMTPHARSRTYSTGRALYALEVPQGWFAANSISVGDRLDGLEAVAKRFPPE